MLTSNGCQLRRAALWRALAGQGAPDAILITSPAHLVYLANFWIDPFQFRAANATATMLLTPDGQATLVADNLLGVFAEQAHVDRVQSVPWYRGRESARDRAGVLAEAVAELLATVHGTRLGFEAGHTPSAAADAWRGGRSGATVCDVSPALRTLRRTKHPDELAVIGRSLAASDAALAAAFAQARPGMTELDLFRLVQRTASETLGAPAWIYGDFLSGLRCQKGSGPASGRVIEPGDLVLLDYSVVVHGYRGDVCHTFVCGGPASDPLRRLYDACQGALSAGAAALAPGREARSIDQAVRAVFARQNMEETFTSHSGHGLGLGHPDPPYLVRASDDVLMAGDVVAVEPGQYIPGVAGMRFEHDYLVTADGGQQLSKHAMRFEQD